MQYTLRNIPPQLDEALRRRAKEEGKSLNEVAVAALMHAFLVPAEATRRRDLEGIAGSWVEDPVVDAALEAQRQVDPEMWE